MISNSVGLGKILLEMFSFESFNNNAEIKGRLSRQSAKLIVRDRVSAIFSQLL